MSFDETINAYFVKTAATSDIATANNETELESALTYLRKHVDDEHIRQIKASEGFPLIASGKLTKKDVFIFDRFEGDFFQQLQQTKSLIIGPRCLICCVTKNEPVPLGTTPVYTTAMRDLHISATGIMPQKKERLRQLIHWMGGHYFQTFGRTITHLISNTIKSTKYEHATLNGIPVMHVDWVERVWERSCVDDVAATHEEFDKYRLPILFGTNVTCTGLSTEKKHAVQRLVNENGGTYHSAFRSQLVDIVITEKDKTKTDKYKAAVVYKKDILLPEWIIDSVEKGFALPTKDYQVKPLRVSTPNKTDQSLANFTQLSNVSRISETGSKNKRSYNQTLDETVASGLNETQQAPCTSKSLQREVLEKMSSAGSSYRLIYDEICPKKAKKAGNFLDGCYIYLSGFRQEEREKLNRILNVGGAVRYDVMHEKITHIIVGALDDGEFRTWKKEGLLNTVNIVRLDWLLESINIKQPASEVVYRMPLPTTREPDAPSPSSKRTLRSMNNSFKKPIAPIKKKLFDQHNTNTETDVPTATSESPLASSTKVGEFADEEHNLMAQYSQESLATAAGAPLPPVATAAQQDLTTQNTDTEDTLVQPHLDLQEQTTSKAAAASAAPCVQPLQTNIDASAATNVTDIDYESLDFFQGMSVYIHKEKFPEDLYSQMIYECEAAQGNLVTNTYKDSVDYAIVTFITTIDQNCLPVRARHIVTELYVEACLKANKLLPIEYYHKHIPSTADVQPLKGMTVNTSIYSGLERDFIGTITELLGAEMSTTFAKKEKPLLVCAAAEGAKYEAALKWRYPVVNSQWLVQCAATGERLSFEPYLVGDCALDFPISPMLRERNATTTALATKVLPALNNDAIEVNIAAAAATTPIANTTKTSATTSQHSTPDFTPLRNKRVTELAGTSKAARNSITTPESPHTPENIYARSSHNFEFMESLLLEIENDAEREALREVIDDLRNNQTPELERIRRMACTPINRKVPTPKGIPEFCTTPAFQKHLADELERRWRLPTKHVKPDTPIEELRKRVMRATCRVMGIPFYETDDDKLQEQPQQQEGQLQEKPLLSTSTSKTPRFTSVFKNVQSSADTTMDTPMLHKTRAAKKQRSLLSNFSLNNSSSSDTYVPATQSPNTTNQLSTNSGMGQRASLGKSTINFDKISFEETEVGAAGAASTVTNANRKSTCSTVTASPEFNKIAEYLKNCETRRQSLKRSRSNSSDGKATAANEITESEAHYVQPFESEHFGSEEVGWRDPVEFSVERRTKVKRTMQYVGTPRFSISCDEKVRADVIQKILNLGGTVSENLVNFDKECTHFLCEKPNRGEKMIGCISSGKWILCLKYIEECYAKDVFINEELYEWGNSKAVNLPELSYDEQLIAQAAHRWRQKLTAPYKKSTGAFDGMCAILHISEKHLASLKNVLKAGKGEIIDVKTPFSKCEGIERITHCFVDIKKNPLKKEDYDFLQQHNVKILSQMYINAYLMHSDDVDVNKYAIKM